MCTSPVRRWAPRPNSLDRRWVFSAHQTYAGAESKEFPCGCCIQCRVAKKRAWATRIVHEASLYRDPGSAFVTATYSPEHFPSDGSLSPAVFKLWCRRVSDFYRGRVRVRGGGVRYFGCGEYGDENLRPHYHVIFFGVWPRDARMWRRGKRGDTLFRSAEMDKLWPYGHVEFGAVTEASASYTAGYVMKKVGGELAEARYRRTGSDPVTGEYREWQVHPEFARMSRNPGIGSAWFDKFYGDAFPRNFVTVEGAKRPVPGYYRDKIRRVVAKAAEAGEVAMPEKVLLAGLVGAAEREARKPGRVADATPERRAVRNEVARLNLERAKREL